MRLTEKSKISDVGFEVRSKVNLTTLSIVIILDMSVGDAGFKAALEEAKKGASEGGVPIGACLVDKNGKILGQGHNMRVQKSSATLHVRSSKPQTSCSPISPAFLISNVLARPKYPPSSLQADFPPQHTTAPPCTPH